MLDPSTWDDKNDTEVLAEYKRRQQLKALFAFCGSHGDETIHHWKAFADGMSGCCVQFDLGRLLQTFKPVKELRFGRVHYRKLRDLKAGNLPVRSMPFTKRWPYRCEEEYRIIWESRESRTSCELDFDLQAINLVTVSQRMPQQVYGTIRSALARAFDNPDQRISRSTIYQNQIWINKFRKA